MAKEFRIWHNSNLGQEPFTAPVSGIEEAKVFLKLLAEYDLYQGDRVLANAQGLLVRENGGEWEDWEDDNGYSITEVMDGRAVA